MIRISRTQRVFTYSSENPPAAHISAGDRLLVETQTAFGDTALQAGRELIDPGPGGADPLTGPIYVEGANVGDALAIKIERIEVIGQPAIGPIQGISILDWGSLPVEILTVENDCLHWNGLELPLRPMVGCIGVAPRVGATPSTGVGDHGGNLDTKHIGAGSTVYLPVFHSGAGLVLGDCHAMQGDGELTGSPPETDAEVTIQVDLVKGLAISRPRVASPDRFMTVASAATVELAGRICVQDMLEALVAETRLTKDQAYVFLTLAADLEVSQVVNSAITVRVAIDGELLGQLR